MSTQPTQSASFRVSSSVPFTSLSDLENAVKILMAKKDTNEVSILHKFKPVFDKLSKTGLKTDPLDGKPLLRDIFKNFINTNQDGSDINWENFWSSVFGDDQVTAERISKYILKIGGIDQDVEKNECDSLKGKVLFFTFTYCFITLIICPFVLCSFIFSLDTKEKQNDFFDLDPAKKFGASNFIDSRNGLIGATITLNGLLIIGWLVSIFQTMYKQNFKWYQNLYMRRNDTNDKYRDKFYWMNIPFMIAIFLNATMYVWLFIFIKPAKMTTNEPWFSTILSFLGLGLIGLGLYIDFIYKYMINKRPPPYAISYTYAFEPES